MPVLVSYYYKFSNYFYFLYLLQLTFHLLTCYTLKHD